MKYTEQFFKDLVKKNNMTMTDLGKALEVSPSTLYKYVKWDENAHHSKKALTCKRRLDEKLSKFIKRREEKTTVRKDSGKYIAVPVNSAEEICYQLSHGIEVFQEGSNDSLKLVEGIIVRFRNNKPVFINCAISLDEKYYIKVPKPVKVEVGKKYLTEKGEVAIVIAESIYVIGCYLVCIIGSQGNMFVKEDGTSLDSTKYDIKLVEKIDD